MIPGFEYDPSLVEDVASRFDLRKPVHDAFDTVCEELASGQTSSTPLVLDMATGAGKTYLMAALVEYLREQGIKNAMIVTPGAVVQAKTVENFKLGARKYIPGARSAPEIVTPDGYDHWRPNTSKPAFDSPIDPIQLFVLNIQQLVRPKDKGVDTKGGGVNAARRAFRTFREANGKLVDYLSNLDDLVVIADEHHLYSESAKAFNEALRELAPAAVVGLTASASEDDHVIYRYPLKQAILDKYVKRPVIAFRKNGYGDRAEEQQLRDAVALLKVKQSYYDMYVKSRDTHKQVNAVLFVQCADVAHATSTAGLLRGPDYFGDHQAVLQVDNEHNDAATLDRLRNVDSPGSTVQAIVSVNKLKEGWDAKNVAVMVTLRAMTSEILTQQTLGRGLRLPFGAWTGVGHIDQLDVIAHDSFHRLLKDEDVMSAFGFDGEVVGRIQHALDNPEPFEITGSTPEPGGDEATHSGFTDPTGVEEPGLAVGDTKRPETPTPGATFLTAGEGSLSLVVMPDDGTFTADDPPEPIEITLNPDFKDVTFIFPATTMKQENNPFKLSSVDDDDLKDAARHISDKGDVLIREEIIVRGRSLSTKSEEDVNVEALSIDAAEVKRYLFEAVMTMREVERTRENIGSASQRIVPAIMHYAGFSTWTVKATSSTLTQLEAVIRERVKAHAAKLNVEPTIWPTKLPISGTFTLPFGKRVHDLLPTGTHDSKFVPHEYYGEWDKGLFPAAAFDSFSTEYQIARLLNRSTDIVWWKRLYASDKASIAYTVKDNYNPDFVAFDKSGYHWIIEGKAQHGKDDAVVQKKKQAADEIIRLLPGNEKFADQKWGYAIAYESDVANAQSWEDLLTSTNPVKTWAFD